MSETPRPEPVDVRPENIPDELRDKEQWICWRYEWQVNREEWAKIPEDGAGGGYRIDATDPNNGVAFETAVETYQTGGYDGLGHIMDPGDLLVGWDWDDVRDSDRPQESVPGIVTEMIETLRSYTEVSPSETGYRAFALGAKPEGPNRADLPCDRALDETPHIEVYDGSGGRYLTVTGQHAQGTPETVKTRPQEIREIYEEYIADDEPPKPTGDGEITTAQNDETPTLDIQETGPRNVLTDLSNDELIDRAMNAKNGEKFTRLWKGQWNGDYPSQSEADQALCNLLAFWVGPDPTRIDSLFRKSGLCRDKWIQRKDYRKRTIEKALKGQSEYYDPSNGESSGAKSQGSTKENTTANGTELPTPAAFNVVDGGYAKWHSSHDDDSEGHYERITNFQIETRSRLTHHDGTREYHLKIHPSEGDAYTVTCEPIVFNDLRKFRREVLDGWTTTFDGSQDHLNRLKEFVGTQDAKDRNGTKLLGLHNDEWVTPDGALTAEGWTDDPDTVFTDVDTPLANAFGLTPDTGDEYDRETVEEILRLLPQTRTPERFLPVLGWFYAAPFRPYIQAWEGEFNMLNVLGDTGSGKTTTLETLWKAFGVDEEMPEAKATPFSIMRMLASSNALPVILDEYKPAELRDYKLNELHSNLRASTRGGVVTKGRADMGVDTYHLKAPVCISGEQPIEGPAEERRTILTVFKRDVTVGQTPEQEAYASLVGGEANGMWYEGNNLTDHATAYYQWILRQAESDLKDLWEQSREEARNLLGDDHTGLDDIVIQGFQTIKFGTTLYRAFASEMGVDPDSTPITTETVNQAIQYVADSGTGAEHTSHLDRLLGVITRAASAGYLVDGEHYKIVKAGKPGAELAIHLPTAFDKVRKYARDHDIRSDDLLSSAGDYKARIRDAADDAASYVTSHSQKTPPLNRCIRIHIGDAAKLVDGFEPEPFGGDADDDTAQSDRFDPVSIHDVADDPTGYPTVKGEIATLDYPEGENSPSIKATLVNDSSAIDLISWDRSDALEVGKAVIIENAGTSEFDGTTQLVLKEGVTTVHEAPGENQYQIDEEV